MWYILEYACDKNRSRNVCGCEIIADNYYERLRGAAREGEVSYSEIEDIKHAARTACRDCNHRSLKLIEVEPLANYHISTPVSECGVPVVETRSGKARVVSVYNLIKFNSATEAKRHWANAVLEDQIDDMNAREINRVTEKILDDPFGEKVASKDQLTIFDALSDSDKLATIGEDELKRRFMEQF